MVEKWRLWKKYFWILQTYCKPIPLYYYICFKTDYCTITKESQNVDFIK